MIGTAAAALDDHGAALGAFAGNVVRFRSGAPARDEAAGLLSGSSTGP